MKKCAIAIPVWKRLISENEFKSFVQCSIILGKNPLYDILFVTKEGIDEAYYNSIWKLAGNDSNAKFIKFPEKCFESRLDYSYLLSSKEFYSKFTSYENILIYQLDAWVFSDELSEWCDKGYDYVGAPWCHLCKKGNCHENFVSDSFVGNGGLSLRRVDSFIKNLPIEKFENNIFTNIVNEDLYISLISNFKKPNCVEASRFSVETFASQLIKNNEGRLPFGFHGLKVYDRELFEKLTNETFAGNEIINKIKVSLI